MPQEWVQVSYLASLSEANDANLQLKERLLLQDFNVFNG